MKKHIFALCCLAIAIAGDSQPGSTDFTYGSAGFVRTDFGAPVNLYPNICQQVLLHPDGTVYFIFEMNEQSFIAHRFSDGTEDPAYGESGYSTPVAMRNPQAVLQPDGKIVLGGYTMVNNSQDFILARFTATGFPDLTFSGDGLQSTDFGSSQDIIEDITLQPDGKIIAAGYSNVGGNSRYVLARYHVNGAPDLSFSGDGKLETVFSSSSSRAMAVVVQPDGKIVAAGNTGIAFSAARYLPDGTPDAGFGTNGLVQFNPGGSSNAKALTLQTDGRIILAGTNLDATGQSRFAILRILPNGLPDNNFSGDGWQFTDFGPTDDGIEAIGLYPNGTLLAVGSAAAGSTADFAIARYLPDGNPDPGFSFDGRQLTSISPGVDFAFSLAVQPDQKFIVAGWSSCTAVCYTLARFHADGSLDRSFHQSGVIVDYKRGGITRYYAAALQSDGMLLAGGGTRPGMQQEHFAVARYRENGTPDSSFSLDGLQVLSFEGGTSTIQAVAVQADGRILLAGYYLGSNNQDFAIARLLPDGNLDLTFGLQGKIVLDFEGGDDVIMDMAVDANGKIVVAGFATINSQRDFALVRFGSDGAPDPGFSGNGMLVTDLGSAYDMATSLAIQPDGKIVAGGNYNYNIQADFALVRYLPDGTLDASFDGDGKVITDMNGRPNAAFSMDLQADGRIVLAGFITGLAGNDFAFARYHPGGALDNSFSGDGLLAYDMGSTNETAEALQITADGKIIAGGLFNESSSIDFGLVRLTPGGAPDPSFGTGGKVTTSYGFGANVIHEMVIAANRLYIVGYASYGAVMGVAGAYQLENIFISCPGNKVITATPGTCSAVVHGIDPPVQNARYTMTGALVASGNGSASGLSFPVGMTTVTYTLANDQNCSFTVHIMENGLPLLQYPNVVDLCFSSTNAYVLPLAGATDACSPVTISYSISGATVRNGTGNNPSGLLMPGANFLTWHVSDGNNQISRTVSIVIHQPPVVSIPDALAYPYGSQWNTVYPAFMPASSLLLNAQASGGTVPYTFNWSHGISDQSARVAPLTASVYSVTVTDAFGCTASVQKSIQVVDVSCDRPGKVLVCKSQGGKHEKIKTICIDAHAVAVQLQQGAILGSCPGTISRKNGSLPVLEVYPNPSETGFTLLYSSGDSAPAILQVIDNTGRVIERKPVTPNKQENLGSGWTPGLYMATIVQGSSSNSIKLVKH